jgi:dihydroflavonol-4-reductase
VGVRALITGGTGFLGSWLTRYLIDAGHDVRLLKRNTNEDEELEGLPYKSSPGDITDLDSLHQACHQQEVVFHLAGVIAYTKDQRPLMEKVNVAGTANILLACQAQKVKRLVHMSSVATVGALFKPGTPLDEDSSYNLGRLDLGYFETKREAEALVQRAVGDNKVDAVILNPSNIYGAGDAKKASRKTQIKVALGKQSFYTSGGVSVTEVGAVVEAIYNAWQKGRSGERYILAGENVTIKELFEKIAKSAHTTAPQRHLPNVVIQALGHWSAFLEKTGRKGPVASETAKASLMYHWFDSSKARRELGYNPPNAQRALDESVNWMRTHGVLN